jgi:hypothetical protein
MMKYVKIVSLIMVINLFNSCIITRTPGFYSGYKRLSIEYKSKITFLKTNDSIPKLNDSITYAITAENLENIVKKNSPCVVYFWSPNCSGTSCISFNSFINFCKTNNYNSIIVSEYYDFNQLALQGVKFGNVYSINHKHYQTDYCNSYMHRFQKAFFELFSNNFETKYWHKYIFYDGTNLTTNKPKQFGKWPWQL